MQCERGAARSMAWALECPGFFQILQAGPGAAYFLFANTEAYSVHRRGHVECPGIILWALTSIETMPLVHARLRTDAD